MFGSLSYSSRRAYRPICPMTSMRDEPFELRSPHPGSAETADDRRRSPRAAYRVVFNLRPLLAGGRAGALVEVILQDLSLVGMGIIHSAAMRRGDQYEVPLQ